MARQPRGMNPFRVLVLPLFFSAFASAHAQVAPLPPWADLARESSVVLVGEAVEAQLWVIDPERRAKAEATPDGKPTLPNPSLFVIGILSRVRIVEIIKGTGRMKEGDLVNIFVYGYFGSDAPHFLMKGEECVLFLRPLDAKDSELTHARVVLPGTFAYPDKQPKFVPDGCYTPVKEGHAQVILTPNKTKVLAEIKQALAKRP